MKKKGKELCALSEMETVDIEKNTFAFRKGWGDEEKGKYWEHGRFLWEAYIDGEFVASKDFFIEDVGEKYFCCQ